MGAAILEHTKGNAGPGGREQRKGGSGRPTLRPSPGSRSWCGPEQHGGRISDPEASPAAGIAVFGVFGGGRLMLHLLLQPSRRYRRLRSLKEGRDETQGTFTPQWASLWRKNSASVTHWLGSAERALALWLRVGEVVPHGCHGRPWAWEPRDNGAGVLNLGL